MFLMLKNNDIESLLGRHNGGFKKVGFSINKQKRSSLPGGKIAQPLAICPRVFEGY